MQPEAFSVSLRWLNYTSCCYRFKFQSKRLPHQWNFEFQIKLKYVSLHLHSFYSLCKEIVHIPRQYSAAVLISAKFVATQLVVFTLYWWQFSSNLKWYWHGVVGWVAGHICMQGTTSSICLHMMTSSNENIFRVTGPLCGEFTGPGEFPTQRPVTRSFGVFFDLSLNKKLSKQPWGWWFETPSWSLWRQCNELPHYLTSLRHHQTQW